MPKSLVLYPHLHIPGGRIAFHEFLPMPGM